MLKPAVFQGKGPESSMTCDMIGPPAISQISVDFFDGRKNLVLTWLSHYCIESFVVSSLYNSEIMLVHL